jgi:hypothetical protein
MTKSKTSWLAAISGIVALATALPAEAMPMPARTALAAVTDAQTVKMDRDQRIWRKHDNNRHGVNRYGNRDRMVKHHITTVRYHTWRGHRGYRDYRPGYRRYNGFWYPPAAFSLGVVIRPGVRHGSAHVRWCRDHYVSYRASDNTFQPYEGPRRACVSPYSR